MRHPSEEIQQLRAKAELSINKTAQLKQVLAQLEANLTRKEIQKVNVKARKD